MTSVSISNCIQVGQVYLSQSVSIYLEKASFWRVVQTYSLLVKGVNLSFEIRTLSRQSFVNLIVIPKVLIQHAYFL